MVLGLAECLILGQKHCLHRQAVGWRPGQQRVWQQMRLQHVMANGMSCLFLCPSVIAQHQMDKVQQSGRWARPLVYTQTEQPEG